MEEIKEVAEDVDITKVEDEINTKNKSWL